MPATQKQLGATMDVPQHVRASAQAVKHHAILPIATTLVLANVTQLVEELVIELVQVAATLVAVDINTFEQFHKYTINKRLPHFLR